MAQGKPEHKPTRAAVDAAVRAKSALRKYMGLSLSGARCYIDAEASAEITGIVDDLIAATETEEVEGKEWDGVERQAIAGVHPDRHVRDMVMQADKLTLQGIVVELLSVLYQRDRGVWDHEKPQGELSLERVGQCIPNYMLQQIRFVARQSGNG